MILEDGAEQCPPRLPFVWCLFFPTGLVDQKRVPHGSGPQLLLATNDHWRGSVAKQCF
jgi:hypothetical protein